MDGHVEEGLRVKQWRCGCGETQLDYLHSFGAWACRGCRLVRNSSYIKRYSEQVYTNYGGSYIENIVSAYKEIAEDWIKRGNPLLSLLQKDATICDDKMVPLCILCGTKDSKPNQAICVKCDAEIEATFGIAALPNISSAKSDACECGGEKSGVNTHSFWCPKFK